MLVCGIRLHRFAVSQRPLRGSPLQNGAIIFGRLHIIVPIIQLLSLHFVPRLPLLILSCFLFNVPPPTSFSVWVFLQPIRWPISLDTLLFLIQALADTITLISENYLSLSCSFLPFHRASLSFCLLARLNYLSHICSFPFHRAVVALELVRTQLTINRSPYLFCICVTNSLTG